VVIVRPNWNVKPTDHDSEESVEEGERLIAILIVSARSVSVGTTMRV